MATTIEEALAPERTVAGSKPELPPSLPGQIIDALAGLQEKNRAQKELEMMRSLQPVLQVVALLLRPNSELAYRLFTGTQFEADIIMIELLGFRMHREKDGTVFLTNPSLTLFEEQLSSAKAIEALINELAEAGLVTNDLQNWIKGSISHGELSQLPMLQNHQQADILLSPNVDLVYESFRLDRHTYMFKVKIRDDLKKQFAARKYEADAPARKAAAMQQEQEEIGKFLSKLEPLRRSQIEYLSRYLKDPDLVAERLQKKLKADGIVPQLAIEDIFPHSMGDLLITAEEFNQIFLASGRYRAIEGEENAWVDKRNRFQARLKFERKPDFSQQNKWDQMGLTSEMILERQLIEARNEVPPFAFVSITPTAENMQRIEKSREKSLYVAN